jgi:hypothetical protein
MDPSFLADINNIYALIGFLIFAITYVVVFLLKKKHNKSQTDLIIEKFEENNKNIIEKLDELKEERNTLDLQSSMDIVHIIFNKSMLKIMEGIRIIMEENNVEDTTRKEIIYGKVKSIVNTQFDEDTLILNRIYHKNNKLSYYMNDLDRFEMITTIFGKINKINDKRYYTDIMDYIRNKFNHTIQTAQLNLSK